MNQPSAMRGQASLKVVQDSQGRSSRARVLQARAPLSLRMTNPKGAEPLVHRARGVARVSLAAGAAGPLGGDNFNLDVQVGAGSTLVLGEISATLVLPGPHGDRSRMRTTVHVAAGATFVWLPEIVIAAKNCNHDHEVCVQLAAGARMVLREETLLGRHRERPGRFHTTLRVEQEGRPLYHQQLRFGPDVRSWTSAAVLGQNKAVGSIIVVDPFWTDHTPPSAPFHEGAVLSPLPGPGVVINAVAADSLALRDRLQQGLEQLGEPWAAR